MILGGGRADSILVGQKENRRGGLGQQRRDFVAFSPSSAFSLFPACAVDLLPLRGPVGPCSAPYSPWLRPGVAKYRSMSREEE